MSSSGDDGEGTFINETTPIPLGAGILDSADASASGRKRGRPNDPSLDGYKDIIVRLFLEDKLPINEITRHLNLTYGLDLSVRRLSRRISRWKIPRTRRDPPSEELLDLVRSHYNNNLNDSQIVDELRKEGYDFKIRRIARLRHKLNLKRKTRFPEQREHGYWNEEGGEGSGAGAKNAKTSQKATIIPEVTEFVQQYMSKYDGSHDFNHIRRVVGLANLIYKRLKEETPESAVGMDLYAITLAALLHDVGDKKYLEPGQDSNTLVLATLLSFGAPEDLAIKVQRIVVSVSYSSEIKDPAQVQAMIQKYPELAVVQDADRLDAIGAVGIGRTFTFGGAKGGWDMGETLQHFDDKLEKLETMMKTGPGKAMARERTERLKTFKHWWEEEEKESREYFAGD
jgi:uncharacterized protein